MKRVLALVLCCVMVVGMLPQVAFAATSGSCGENVTWSFVNGKLTISGTGAMKNWGVAGNVPWFSHQEDILSVEIKEGVTTIGQRAFSACYELKSVTIPDSVTTIGKYAFSDCESLQSVTIPNSVTTIRTAAFLYCFSLTNVTIPASVTLIEKWPFGCCTSLVNIAVDEGNTMYRSENGVLFSKDGTVLVQYPGGKEGRYTIPTGVTHIEENAFSNCELTGVTIPDSVTTIGQKAFSACSELKNVTIPDSVTVIGEAAFAKCKKLTDVYYGGSRSMWNALSIEKENEELKNATVHFAVEEEELLGDVNLDGAVDVYDAVTLFQYSMLPDLYQIEYTGSVDFNGDGAVDVYDAVLLFQHSMLPDLYPIG